MRVFKIFLGLCIMLLSMSAGYCTESIKSASVGMSFTILPYTHISPITSPVLTAYITDKTGNLQAPLSTTFRVITNSPEDKTLYLKANVLTQDGYEEAMFEQGGQVYIAFTNLKNKPTGQSLNNCKIGSAPNDSPNVVAYPITSLTGAASKTYLKSKDKYELTVKNGTSFITVNVGSNVLKSSFGGNDPRGFYQAILSLTEADI